MAHYWEDDRLLNPEVDNLERFLEASENIYLKYRYYNEGREKKGLQGMGSSSRPIDCLAGQRFSGSHDRYRNQRIAAYRECAEWLGDFDETIWLNEAIEVKVRGFRDSKDGIISKLYFLKDEYYWREDKEIEKTDWFRFQEAVKEHQQLAMAEIKPIFAKMGINLHHY